MEANLLAAEPTAPALREHEHGDDKQQPKADAHEERTNEANGDGSPLGGFLRHAVTMAIVTAVAAAQLLWGALLVYGMYSAAAWLPL